MSLLTRAKDILKKDEAASAKKAAPKKEKAAPAAEVKQDTAPETSTTLAQQIGLAGVLTEKSMRAQEKNIVMFRVKPQATKHQIRLAIEEAFNVTPKDIRTARFLPKTRRRGLIAGSTNAFKKVYVKVDDVRKITGEDV